MRHEASVTDKQSGLGMIEILVALMILSIGLLGLAAMPDGLYPARRQRCGQ